MRASTSAYFTHSSEQTAGSADVSRAHRAITKLRARKRTRAGFLFGEESSARGAPTQVGAAATRTTATANEEAALATGAKTGATLTEMEKQVVAIRAQHRDMFLLFECGYRMRIFAEDAEIALNVLGIKVHQYKNFKQASVPVHRTLHHCRRLVEAGYKVGIVKQIDTVAMRALNKINNTQVGATITSATRMTGAPRPLLQRKVVEVYTRATIPLPDLESEQRGDERNHAKQSDDATAGIETPPKFILCVVEETVHQKAFFTKKLHEAADSENDEKRERSRKQVDDVRIGLFAHDVHTGESLFDEFQDDGNRKLLQTALERIEPVEIVLPRGKLSVYTEQILQSYANLQSTVGGDTLQQNKRIRFERLPNDVFEWNRAKATLTQFFDDARLEYQHYVHSRPSLPPLSVCCFGGMWHYLKAFELDKSLISTNYSPVQATAMINSNQEFRLPSESLRDLDIFRNSSTGEATGSLFSILNQTRTEFGARKLRAWLRSPSTSISDIKERQNTVRHLVGDFSEFPSCASSSYQLVYEELVETLLPKSTTLLRCVNQIHTRKISPIQLVKGIQSFLNIEKCVDTIIGICSVARLEGLQLGGSQPHEEPTLLLRLLQNYPRLRTQLVSCLEEINQDAAIANDMESAILQRLRLNVDLLSKYQALCNDLLALDDEFETVLKHCRSVLQDESLEFASFRYGIAKEVHHLVVVKREDLRLVPSDWLVVNSNKKIVRFHSREIHQLHMRQEFLLQMKSQLVQFAWREFVAHVDAQLYVLASDCVEKLATIDAICSLATVARTQPGYTLPEYISSSSQEQGNDGERVLRIVGGRNAILETTLFKASYMSNSIEMVASGDGFQETSKGSLLVISGPNMGGKSSLLRMCALIILMAQIGAYVPAEMVQLSIFDGIFTRMHRANSFQQGEGGEPTNSTTRSSEMEALSTISQSVTRKSFVLIDELGFGMTARQASALAFGLMTYFVENIGCHVMFATHTTRVIERLEQTLKTTCQTKQFKFSLSKENQGEERGLRDQRGGHKVMTFHYTIKDGIASESFALHAARLAGIPEDILRRAEGERYTQDPSLSL